MHAEFTAEERAFRDQVRRFCEERLPEDIRAKVLEGRHLSRADHIRWQKILHEQGWIAGFWPKKWGGCDWTPVEGYIFQEETARAGAPWLLPFGVNYVGPVIFTYGNADQQERHLPGILSSDVFWCQGYSEPGAGSDLAGLKTRAVRDGDHYVVNGSKIWTTMAHWADMMFCLARTDADAARPQEGISFLLLDMKQPGVTVRPIVSIDGAHHLNEVFFDDVRVPVSERVGDENRGWTYAKFLLGHERMLSAETGKARRLIGKIRRMAARLPHANGRGVLADDARFRDRIARLEIRVLALEWTTLRMLDAAMEGASPGAEASLLKIRGSELVQAITELATDVLGLYGIPFDVRLLEAEAQGVEIGPDGAAGILAEFLYHRAPTIWGGSNEVQRNILAKHALGL